MNKPLLLTLITWVALSAPTAYAETLLQAYQDAKQNDDQLKAQETSFLAMLENKQQALAGKKPQISLSGSAGLQQNINISDSLTDGYINGSYTLGLSKSLYNKNLDAQIEQVDASLEQAKIQLEGQRQSLIMRVAQPYFSYLNAVEQLNVANTQKKAFQQQLNQVQAFFDVGKSPITDLKEAESRYNLTVAQEVAAQTSVINAREDLRVVTGKPYAQLGAVANQIPLAIPSPSTIQAWVDIAKKNSKSLLAAKQSIEIARQKVEVQRASRSPTVNLYARHTGSFKFSDSPIDPVTAGASVGVEASMPLYQGGSISSKIRQAQHEFRQAQQNYQYQEKLLESQVRSAFNAIETNISQVKAQQQALISAETAAQATKTGFEVGTRTAVDVLTTLSDVFSARRDYANARHNYLLSTLQLRNAAGTLSENDLQSLSQLLNNSTNVSATRNNRNAGANNNQQAQRLRQIQLAKQEAKRRQQQHEARLRAEKQRKLRELQLREQRLRQQRANQKAPPAAQQQPSAQTNNTPAETAVEQVIHRRSPDIRLQTNDDFVFTE